MSQKLSYSEVEQYILDIPKFCSKNTLEDMSDFLEMMGNPGMQRKIIHVAGTNGKGSVCAYLQSILSEAGYHVGMFTSPHLVTMRERICINENMITENEFCSIFVNVMNIIKSFSQNRKNSYHPSFFEFLFSMAMRAFEDAQVDYIILETGLGGRLDATNVIKTPKICIITEIGYDHTEFLGKEISQIAGEKAGIIKHLVPVVYYNKNKFISDILQEKALEMECLASFISPLDLNIEKLGNKTIDFSIHSRYYKYISLSLSTKAKYQMINAALAVQAIEELKEDRITEEHIRTGLFRTYWPGRMEEIESGVYLDGAHNVDGMQALLETVATDGCQGNRYLIFSAVEEKNYEEMIRLIAESRLFERVTAVPLQTKRSVTICKLRAIFSMYKLLSCVFYDDVSMALEECIHLKRPEDYVYIAGSLYLAGEIVKRNTKVQKNCT